MEVQAPEARHGQHVLREDREGDDDEEVRADRAELRLELRRLQVLGLEDGQSELERGLLDGRRLQVASAPGGAVGLRDRAEHLVLRLADEKAQEAGGELGRAEKEDLHQLAISRTMRLISSFTESKASTTSGSKCVPRSARMVRTASSWGIGSL